MSFRSSSHNTIRRTALAAAAADSIIWTGGVISQDGGSYKVLHKDGTPLLDEAGNEQFDTAPSTGMLIRQAPNGVRTPFWPLRELLEVGTFTSTAVAADTRVGQQEKSMRAHAFGFEIVCDENGLPIFDGQPVQYMEDTIGPDNSVTSTFVQPKGDPTLIVHFRDGHSENILASVVEADDLYDSNDTVKLNITSNVMFGQARNQENAVRGLDYLFLNFRFGDPRTPGRERARVSDGKAYTRDETDWTFIRSHEATILSLCSNCESLAAQYPEQFGKLPDYLLPVSHPSGLGYVRTSSSAPSVLMAQAAAQRAAEAETSRFQTSTVDLSSSIPSSAEDLLGAGTE